MAEYVNKEDILETITSYKNELCRLTRYRDLFATRTIETIEKFINEQPIANVIEIEKIDKAIKEMEELADHKIKPISFDQEVAIDMCIEILKEIKE